MCGQTRLYVSDFFFGNLFGFQVKAVHSSFISEGHKNDLLRHPWLSWQMGDVIEGQSCYATVGQEGELLPHQKHRN